jgi:hypothetical protein
LRHHSLSLLVSLVVWFSHWQNIRFLPRPIKVAPAQYVPVACLHDDYSVWFDVEAPAGDKTIETSALSQSVSFSSVAQSPTAGPVCTCSHHAVVSPAVLLQRHSQEVYWAQYSLGIQRALAAFVQSTSLAAEALPTVLHVAGGGSLALLTGMMS